MMVEMLRAFSFGFRVRNLASSRRMSLEADWLWVAGHPLFGQLEEVDQGDHKEDRDLYKVNLCGIIGAC